jgi:transposase
MVDRNGVPLSCRVSAANVHDVRMLLAVVIGCPLARYGTRGRRPKELLGDRAYDSGPHRDVLRWLGVEPVIARRGEPHGSGLGKDRYVVERTIAALHQNRRLKIRYERRSDLHQAFLTLACIKVCWYRLDPRKPG